MTFWLIKLWLTSFRIKIWSIVVFWEWYWLRLIYGCGFTISFNIWTDDNGCSGSIFIINVLNRLLSLSSFKRIYILLPSIFILWCILNFVNSWSFGVIPMFPLSLIISTWCIQITTFNVFRLHFNLIHSYRIRFTLFLILGFIVQTYIFEIF